LNESAVNAQKNLHEKRTLPEVSDMLHYNVHFTVDIQMNHPMQVKPATQTSKDRAEDRRLFVGQIAPDMNEEQVANMFAPFGIVEDVSILRGKDGISKKAAFVRMSSRAEALKAIEALHQSQTLPVSKGNTSTL
jgi:CUG-BP- and ETR3-like factor